jgi:hypothetical protein
LHKEDLDRLDRWIGFAASSEAKIIAFDLKKNYSLFEEVHHFPLEALGVQGSSCVQSLFLVAVSIKPHPGMCGFTVLRRTNLSRSHQLDKLLENQGDTVINGASIVGLVRSTQRFGMTSREIRGGQLNEDMDFKGKI